MDNETSCYDLYTIPAPLAHSMKILLTGGGGRLGTELRALLPHLIAPGSQELDVTSATQVRDLVGREAPDVIVHAAAYTNVGGAEREREKCWAVNVQGTRNVAHASNLVGAKLVHISTDYVFSGETGNYSEEDTPGPVVNFYSLSKLVAEEAARAAERHLILRTSFRPREFQYPVAYSDTELKRVYKLARRRNPAVREGTRAEAGVTLPSDVSLNTGRWE